MVSAFGVERNVERQREIDEENERRIREAQKVRKRGKAWTKTILAILNGDEEVTRSAIKDHNLNKTLRLAEDMSDAEMGVAIGNFIAFSIGGAVGSRLGARAGARRNAIIRGQSQRITPEEIIEDVERETGRNNISTFERDAIRDAVNEFNLLDNESQLNLLSTRLELENEVAYERYNRARESGNTEVLDNSINELNSIQNILDEVKQKQYSINEQKRRDLWEADQKRSWDRVHEQEHNFQIEEWGFNEYMDAYRTKFNANPTYPQLFAFIEDFNRERLGINQRVASGNKYTAKEIEDLQTSGHRLVEKLTLQEYEAEFFKATGESKPPAYDPGAVAQYYQRLKKFQKNFDKERAFGDYLQEEIQEVPYEKSGVDPLPGEGVQLANEARKIIEKEEKDKLTKKKLEEENELSQEEQKALSGAGASSTNVPLNEASGSTSVPVSEPSTSSSSSIPLSEQTGLRQRRGGSGGAGGTRGGWAEEQLGDRELSQAELDALTEEQFNEYVFNRRIVDRRLDDVDPNRPRASDEEVERFNRVDRNRNRLKVVPSGLATAVAGSLLAPRVGATTTEGEVKEKDKDKEETPQEKQADQAKEDKQTGDTGFHESYPNNYKQTIDYKNLSSLFERTLELSDIVYDNNPRNSFPRQSKAFWYSEFSVPFLILIEANTCYLTFRGTDFKSGDGKRSLQNVMNNVLTDLDTVDILNTFDLEKQKQGENERGYLRSHPILKRRIPQSHLPIKFHAGGVQAVAECYENIRTELDKLRNNVNNLVITGHSLGGLVATIFYYMYQIDAVKVNEKIKVSRVITWGSPRALVNKPEYIKAFNKVCNKIIRVWNTNDLISYIPFNKATPALGEFVNKAGYTGAISGMTHVGRSFCINGNYENQNVNLLLEEILKTGGDVLEELVSEKENIQTSALVKFMFSQNYLSALTSGVCLMAYTAVPSDQINDARIRTMAKKLMVDSERITNYSEKCGLLKDYNLERILRDSPIGEGSEEAQNFTIASLPMLLAKFLYNPLVGEDHKHSIDTYQIYLDRLIERERIEKIPIKNPIKQDSDDLILDKGKEKLIIYPEGKPTIIELPKSQPIGLIYDNSLASGTFIELNTNGI